MMKRIIFILLTCALSLLFLFSCSDSDEDVFVPETHDAEEEAPEDEAEPVFKSLVNPLYKIVSENTSVIDKHTDELIDAVKVETGKTLRVYSPNSSKSLYEIQIGSLLTRNESKTANESIADYENKEFSAYTIRFYGTRLVVTATDEAGYSLAFDELMLFISDGDFSVPEFYDKTVIFKTAEYLSTGKVEECRAEELDSYATADTITVNGAALDGFSPDITEYEALTDCISGYPVLSASPRMKAASVQITQPTKENGGAAKITVTSKDTKHTIVYKVNFKMKEIFETKSEVVNKNGASGVITLVIDDGNISTARIAEQLLAKYPDVTLTFAMITRKIAGFELSEDQTEYKRDENGRFIITQTEAQKTAAEYWQGLLQRFPYVEITSHSHTHAYAGEDDSKFHTDYDNQGNAYVFPKGAISAEIIGSKQIIEELFGQKSPGFILPGISGGTLGLTTNSWMPLLKSGIYLGARGTASSLNVADMTVSREDLMNESALWRSKAFMIRYFNVATYVDEGGKKHFYSDTIEADEAIAAGVSHATDFVDSAIENGEWACFCLHDIINVGSSGSHPVYTEQADALFAHINALGESKDAWVATYGDALTYYCEWNAAKTTATAHEDKYIELSVTCEQMHELYTMPLTVKVTVPDTWTKVSVEYLGTAEELSVEKDEDGTSFIYANVAPETAPAVITPID